MKYAIGSNQHKKKRKWKVVRNWAILIVIVWGLVVIGTDTLKSSKMAPKSIVSSQKDICAGDSQCQAKIENLASQTLLQKQIDQTKEEYDQKLKDLEARMETLRQEELSLQ